MQKVETEIQLFNSPRVSHEVSNRRCPSDGYWRILLVVETSGGGSGRHVVDLARELIHIGHEVHIVYSGTRIEQQFANEIKSLSGRQHTIDMRRAPHPSDLLAIKRIREYCTRFGPFHIVHGHSSKGGALARLAGIGHGAIRVYTPHALRTLDPTLNRVMRWVYNTAELILSRISDGIILVSEEEKAHALANGFSQRKLFLVPNGIPPADVMPRALTRRRLRLGEDDVCIGFVGRFVPQKAAHRLVSAFGCLASRFPLLRLVMVGEGPMQVELRHLAERCGVNERIIWLNNACGREIMPAFDIFVMPSLYEGFPYVLAEAAAAALPIVATPVGGTSAIVRDKVNGFLVGHTQQDELVKAIATLVEKPALRRKMGEVSRRIAETYTVQNMVGRTCEVYSEVLSRRAAKASRDSSLRNTLSTRGRGIIKLL
ncbi:MAG: glycosyltransferase [Gammaproteobacteria bacterium]